MAQHSNNYVISNQTFPATRTDLNNLFSAIKTGNSGSTAPSSPSPGQLWYDTINNKLKVATDTSGTFVDVALDSSGNQTVTGTLGVTGVATFTAEAVFNGGIALGDSDKATFGAGDDLEIYHDSSNSYIKDTGSGNLFLEGTGSVFIRGSSTSEYLAKFNENGSVQLYYDNTEKLATNSSGIAVDGNCYVADDNNVGNQSTHERINFNATGSHISFYTGDAEKMRLESDGDLHADGDVIAYSTTISDERLKTGIHTIQDALDKVYSLKGVEFTYKADGKRSAGLIAQDVEKVLPSAVSEKQLPLKVEDGNEYKVLQYDQTIGLLVEAVKELKDLVDEQAQEIELLKKG